MSLQWSIETYDIVSSTQDILKKQAIHGAREGSAIYAYQQTSGRGRQGRNWHSPLGNIYLSALLRPQCEIALVGQLSLLSCLAVSKAIEDVYEDKTLCELKWPNDILINRKKCAGILLETDISANNQIEWIAIGIGVNLKNAPLETSVSIEQISHKNPDILSVRDNILKELAEHYISWKINGFEELRLAWTKKCGQKNENLVITLGAKEIKGYFHDLDHMGNLVLKDNSGALVTIRSGQIALL